MESHHTTTLATARNPPRRVPEPASVVPMQLSEAAFDLQGYEDLLVRSFGPRLDQKRPQQKQNAEWRRSGVVAVKSGSLQSIRVRARSSTPISR